MKKAASRPFSGERPSDTNASWMSGAMPVHTGASAAPSNVTVPIMTASSSTAPGSGFHAARPESGLRRPTCPSRVVQGEMRENRLKYTPNASPLRDHSSTPYSAMPMNVAAE